MGTGTASETQNRRRCSRHAAHRTGAPGRCPVPSSRGRTLSRLPPALVVGWREWVHLPNLGVRMVKAKVDTGARTSSLHAENVRIQRNGLLHTVVFTVHPRQRSRVMAVEAEAPLVDERWVRSSNGTQELRPVIMTTIDV